MTAPRHRKYSECAFTEWFCNALERVNGYTLAFVGHRMQQSGVPDRYICHRKWHGWVEFKANERVVMTNQRVVMQNLLDRGDHVLVVRAIDRDAQFTVECVPAIGQWCGDELLRVDVRIIKARELDGIEPAGTALITALADAWSTYELGQKTRRHTSKSAL